MQHRLSLVALLGVRHMRTTLWTASSGTTAQAVSKQCMEKGLFVVYCLQWGGGELVEKDCFLPSHHVGGRERFRVCVPCGERVNQSNKFQFPPLNSKGAAPIKFFYLPTS